MTKIKREKLEHDIVTNIFLPLLRLKLVEPGASLNQNHRPTNTWVRSSMPVRDGVANKQVRDFGAKRNIVKESLKPQYPYVIVENFNENNEVATIKVNTDVYYKVPCELTIRLVDVGDVTRISNLAGQISSILKDNRESDLLAKGLSRLKWNIVSTPGYSSDDGEMNEKQILLTFDARVDEWQL